MDHVLFCSFRDTSCAFGYIGLSSLCFLIPWRHLMSTLQRRLAYFSKCFLYMYLAFCKTTFNSFFAYKMPQSSMKRYHQEKDFFLDSTYTSSMHALYTQKSHFLLVPKHDLWCMDYSLLHIISLTHDYIHTSIFD